MNNRQSTCVSDNCPVCDSTDIDIFVEISDVPVHCNRLWPSREDALRAPKGDIRLGFCVACGHIFNIAFNSDLMKYSQEYENSLHFSPRFQEYARSLATRLLQDYDLYNKDIIEIGCGKGDFLMILCELGQNRGIGFDPSYVPGRIQNPAKGRFTIIQDFYSERYANYNSDIICCRHVLEHIRFPRDFLNSVCRSITRQSGTVVYFEVPNVMFTLKHLGIWDLIYEHCGYFTLRSLAHIFDACGFHVTRLKDGFEGQFLCIDALPVEGLSHLEENNCNSPEETADYVSAFADRYNSKIEELKCMLERMQDKKQRVVIWGAGSKGVTFLNTCKLQDKIEYVVDINPAKHGMYVAGTGQKIVEPEFLRQYRPDTVIAMNPIYLNEIQRIILRMKLSSALISV